MSTDETKTRVIRRVVNGQVVTDEKLALSRRLRRDSTPSEARLWACLRGRRVAGAKFRRQQVIDGFVADFYCSDAGLIIELDGLIHKDQSDYDAARDAILKHRVLRVLRFANSRIEDDLPNGLVEIEHAVNEGQKPSTPVDA